MDIKELTSSIYMRIYDIQYGCMSPSHKVKVARLSFMCMH